MAAIANETRQRAAATLAHAPALARIVFIVLLASAACGPRVRPEGPGMDPGSPQPAAPGMPAGAVQVEPRPATPAREMLIGEMCPTAADGRPAVLPLFLRSLGWTHQTEDVTLPVESRAARLFSVLAWDGRRAGLFSVAGVADVGERRAAVGAYAGALPCAPASGKAGGDDAACTQAQSNCGLAVAALEPSGDMARPFDEEPDPVPVPVGGACLAGDRLLVDIDGDGAVEAYPVNDFLDPVRAPDEEVLAVPRGNATCTPAFAIRHVIPPGDPRHWQGMDLLGVLDLDGDGRRELVMSYHYSERRTWAVFSPVGGTGRLDLIGEAVPWPNR